MPYLSVEISQELHKAATAYTSREDTATIDDPIAAHVALIKAQQDLSDGIITYRTVSTGTVERAARTRRVEFSRRGAFANTQAIRCAAVQQHLAAATVHLLNTYIALSRVLPLNLPKSLIPYPFHGFW